MGRLTDALLGDDVASYPEAPGWKEPTTSRDAALAVASGAAGLREAVFAAIERAGPDGLTSDEAAAVLGRSVLAVRPRVTELSKASRIVPTGERRRNVSTQKAKAWRIA